MTDFPDVFWASVDSDAPLFTAADLARWPADMVDQMLGLGLLRLTDNASHVVCPACDEGHVEEVVPRQGRDGKQRFYIRCPEALRVEVAADLLRQWTIDFQALVSVVAAALKIKGRPKNVVPGRLWRLGKTPWKGANRDLLFARGLALSDAGQVTCRVGPNGRPIVLVAEQAPEATVWSGRPPAVVVMAQIATLGEDGLEIDAADLAARVNEAEQHTASVLAVPGTPTEQKLALRRQVKAEVKAQLEDDGLVAAYKQFGSYRKAADYLSQQLERPVSKDKVFRAVRRAGGPAAVMRRMDSASVRRSVASQRRDTTGRILHRPKLPDSE